MWCNKLLFMSFVASSFLVITSAAPLQKREAPSSHSRFEESSVFEDVKIISLQDGGVDKGKKVEQKDYDDTFVPSIDLVHHENLHKTGSESESKGGKGFKTICENSGGGSKCADDDSIDELLRKIKAIADGKKELKESELKTISELVDKLTKKVHELEQKCGDDNNRRKRLVAKIMMRESIETDDKSNKKDGNSFRTDQISRTYQSPPARPAFPPPAPPTINYVQNLPADVNYNGGMNKPIDVLKVLYPHGHWPDEDYANRAIPIQPADPSASLDYYNDYNQVGYETNHRVPDDFDFHDTPKDKESSLTPEYLESIIRNERMFPPSGNQRRHHVQEH